ncbi:MAG: T9SS type A sorting domain-containing protein [Bacteroidota bacterium]
MIKKTQSLFTLIFLLGISFAFSQSITWEVHQGQGAGIFTPSPDDPPVSDILNELTGGRQAIHGDPGGFQYADIPDANDAGWEVAQLDEDGDLCWRLDRSRLTASFTALDFTYFQTSIFVTDASAPFILRFYQVDDGARAYVFNSRTLQDPENAFIEGGDARLFAPIAETDISPLFVEGEENRIVIVQFDDSQTANYLKVETIIGEGVDECDISIENVFVADEPCDGSEIGAIEIDAACGSCTEEPLYSIDGGATFGTASFLSVPAGEYNVVIRDASDETCISNAQTVIVGIEVDTEAPQFPDAENIPLEVVDPCALVDELPARYEASSVTDNCDINPIVDIQREIIEFRDTTTRDIGDGEIFTTITFRGRQINYIYTATDASDNQNSITIETWFIPAGAAPEITSDLGTSVNDILNVCGEYPVSAETLGLSITDDCTPDEDISVEIQIFTEFEPRTNSFTTIDAIVEPGEYTVGIRVIDEVGNEGFQRIDFVLEANPAFYTVTAEDDVIEEAGDPFTFTAADLLANDDASNGATLEIQDISLVDPSLGTLTDNQDGSYTLTRADAGTASIELSYVAKSEDESLYFEGTGHYYEFVPFAGTQETILTESFNGGLPNGWTAEERQGDGQATANWFWTNSGPSGDFAVEPINSTSADNGWMLFDSDLNCSQQNQEAWLVSPELDASNLTSVSLQFQTLYRSFNDRPTIEVSTDLENWTSFEVFPGVEANTFGSEDNPQIVNIDISSVAANQSTFFVAFRFLSDETTNNGGNLTGCGYSWQMDDAVITGTSEFSGGTTWEDARVAAEARTLNGLNGYLATVTSQEENDFILSKLEGQGWMGASDVEQEGNWKWVTGPEAGTTFWIEGVTTEGQYSNWADGEPNNFVFNNGEDEDYAHFLTDGAWNDFPIGASSVVGYVVEYGGVDGCAPNFTDEAIVTVNFASGAAEIVRLEAVEERSIKEDFEVNVAPNPFQMEANLQVNLLTEATVSIEIRDMSGRIVKSLSLKGSAGENTFVIHRDGLATGVYVIAVRTASAQQTLKVVITQ